MIRWVAPLMLGLASVSATVWAQTATNTLATDGAYRSSSLSAYPPNIAFGSGGPMMMLAASKDHTLFSPIYTDYEDVDGDGVDDYTFKPDFKYYGYFDPTLCYSYNSTRTVGAGKRFEPSVAATVTITDATATTKKKTVYSCPTTASYWSGNFLNWATMTRIDVVRKMLYGGFRREDTVTAASASVAGSYETTLEMAQLSQDAHSFVKYYAGADLRNYTPYSFDATASTPQGLTICNRGSINQDPTANTPGAPVMRVVKGNYSLWATIPGTVCRWQEELDQDNENSSREFVFGKKAQAFYKKYGPSTNDNTAHQPRVPAKSDNPELTIRVQACKQGLLGEQHCQAYTDGTTTYYKPVGLLQQFGSTQDVNKAPRAEFGLITGSYDSSLRGGALRKNMGSVNDEIDASTGRFCHRITGTLPSACKTSSGIIKSFDSIRLYDTGNYQRNLPNGDQFVLPTDIQNGWYPSWGNPISEMLVQALAYMAGKDMSEPTSVAMDKTVGLPTAVTRQDPLNDSTTDPASGRLRKNLYGKSICRAMNVLAISSGTASFDTADGAENDVYGVFSSGFVGLNDGSSRTLAQLTDVIGTNEGINGTERSVGSNAGAVGSDCTKKLVGTAGDLVSAGLSRLAGICPEAPAVKGSYLGAGAAYFANTNAIRELGHGTVSSSLTSNTGADISRAGLPAHALRLKTYAASLAGGVIRIEVPLPNGRSVYITPESSWDHGLDSLMPGAALTFRAIRAEGPNADQTSLGSATYIVTWNDAQFGGDYDMDMVGVIRWELKPSAVSGEYDLEVLTDVLNNNAGAKGSHGFSIIGTKAAPSNSYRTDGRYLTHGSNGFSAPGSDCAGYAANSAAFWLKCNFADGGMPKGINSGNLDAYDWPASFGNGGANVGFIDDSTKANKTSTVITFRVKEGAGPVTLRDPLWYAAKYGSFDTGETAFASSKNVLPQASNGSQPVNWDRTRNNGEACTGACADGEPDGYFLARRPDLLEERLTALLDKLVASSNTAPSISSSQLVQGSFKFVAEFSKDDNNGTIKAFAVNSETAAFSATAAWDAGDVLSKTTSRQVLTNRQATTGQQGVAFTDTVISATNSPDYVTALTGGTSTAQADRAAKLVRYMRGSNTAADLAPFRKRDANIMGTIVNSSPWVHDTKSSANFNDVTLPAGTPSYRSFVVTKATRDSTIWVGANDGMLHGFKVPTSDSANPGGSLLMSFVPSPLANRLSTAHDVANTNAVSLMDGSPYVGDVLVGSGTTSTAWKSYLFSSLGRGGRAVFALDVTDPSALTEANAASVFKWMFTASDDPDLGYNLTDPVRHNVSGQATPIVRLNNGKFGVLVPNGYKSANGRAVMFILFVDGPTGTGGTWQSTATARDYVKLTTSGGTGTNGMMGVNWVDLNNDGVADVLYGTDLLGNVWKFDIRDQDPSRWGSAFESTTTPATLTTAAVTQATPFFTAVDSSATPVALPITTAPVVSFPKFGGAMISFATGQSIETGDFPNSARTQRFFSVWDQGSYVGDRITPPVVNSAGAAVVSRPLPGTDSNRLVSSNRFLKIRLARNAAGQVYQITTKDGVDVPVESDAFVAFDPAVHDGWLFDFPSAGEAVISSPVGRQGFVFFTAIRPQVSEATSCDTAPLAAGYAFNPVTALPVRGLLTAATLADKSYDAYAGNVSDSKVIVVSDKVKTSSLNCTAGAPNCPTTCPAGSTNCPQGPPQTCGAGKTKVRILGQKTDASGCVAISTMRIQWREIPGMKTK